MNHTASGLPRPDKKTCCRHETYYQYKYIASKIVLCQNTEICIFPSNLLLFTLLLKSFCVTQKKWENGVGEHESID